VPFETAERYLLSQIPVTKEEWEKLDKNFRLHAFTIARLTELDAIERVKQHLAKAKQEGKTFKQFWETAGKDELLRQAGFHKSNPWYWETVFRNNIQRAYNAGRAYQIQRSEAVEYLEFVGIRDARQSPICRARSGIIKPKDDPFWASNWPPLHHGCRSTVRAITKYEMKWHGLKLTEKLPPMPAPQKGFGNFPQLQAGFVFQMNEKMWERAKRYGIDEEIRKTYQRLYPSMKLPEDKEVKNLLWHEKIKHLDFSKDEHVAEFIDFLAEIRPEWFPYGVKAIFVTPIDIKDKAVFMATEISKRLLFLYYTKEKFNALQQLKSALLKLKYGKPLAKEEKYALRAFWHEIWHLRAKKGFTYEPPDGENYLMEALNEYMARETLAEFLESLGSSFSKKQWEEAFSMSGYHEHVENLIQVLRFTKLTDLPRLKEILLERYDGLSYTISKLIGEKLGWSESKIASLHNLIVDYFKDSDKFIQEFKKLVEK